MTAILTARPRLALVYDNAQRDAVGQASRHTAGASQGSTARPLHPTPRANSRGRLMAASLVCCAQHRHTKAAVEQLFNHASATDLAVIQVGTKPPSSVRQYDYLVIGSGIAGLTHALKVAAYGRVAIITKDKAHEGCTQYAQGGVCAVLDARDSVADHVRDTIIAGQYLNDLSAVEVVCREGPARVLELVELGADFTRNADGSLHLTREGGHNQRRIVHAADLTGREIERALLAAVKAHPNITMFEHHLAIDLVVADHACVPHCFGADVLDQRSMIMTRFVSFATMLASGGAGQVYPSTTNPHVATGDGIAMAYRAGAAVANMEFVQFHPTALYTPPPAASSTAAAATPTGDTCDAPVAAAAAAAPSGGQTFLITEAMRGEGAVLRNLAGERFMEQYDPVRMELAPRDVVARAIQDQMLKRGEPHVWLDISHRPAEEVLGHFPNIAARCVQEGIDITRQPIPVLPAQHYTCGGVQTGLLGETNIQGLYACGEVACSGLHGANRLASNSLLEGLVFADRAVNPSVAHAEHAAQQCSKQLREAISCGDGGAVVPECPPSARVTQWAARRRGELRDVMWRQCGIVRSRPQLLAARDFVAQLQVEARAVFHHGGRCTAVTELLNLVTCAELIVTCALQRKESRGLHYVVEHPAPVERERRASVVSLLPKQQQQQLQLLEPRIVVVAGGGLGGSLGSKVGSGGTALTSVGKSGSNAAAGAKKRGGAAVAPRGDVAVRSSPEEQ